MYAAIYSYEKENTIRKHLGNIIDINYNVTVRTFEFGDASVTGYFDFDIDANNALIYVICDEAGKQQHAGFIKNIKTKENRFQFLGDDFKRILDTDILLDYTGQAEPSFKLKDIFNKVANGILSSNRDNFLSHINLQFMLPDDETDTKIIADYTGQYIIVNALKFLKVYLAYFNYYLKTSYDIAQDTIFIEFDKSNFDEIVPIKLKDFIHEKTSNDIKVNKTIATVSFAPARLDPEWEESTEEYYNSQPDSNKASIHISETMPATSAYSPGFALRVVGSYSWIHATESDYTASTNKITKIIHDGSSSFCSSVTFQEAIEAMGDPSGYAPHTAVFLRKSIVTLDALLMRTIKICEFKTYIKLITTGTLMQYYKVGLYNYTKRPALPERVYVLGKDNNIYEGYDSIAKSNRHYPVVSKLYEAEHLSEAQINAVYELVNNRYIENIIITQHNTVDPLDLTGLDLYTMIRVYDDNGNYKDLPISEKTTTYAKCVAKTEIKLGFKKTLLTEIIKNDIGEENVIKQSGGQGSGGGTTVINEEYKIWTEDTAPDPEYYDTWFKPIGE